MPAPVKHFDWNLLLPAAVAGLIVVAGWVVVERFARTREKRNDFRELAGVFDSTIDDIVRTATHFYQLDGSEPLSRALANSLRSMLGTLPELIALMNKGKGKSQIEANDQLRLFRQAVSGGEFDSIARKALSPNATTFETIATASQDLARHVRLGLYKSLI